jgi:PAS domain S-box-containing protein
MSVQEWRKAPESDVRRRVLIVDHDPAFGRSLEPDFQARGFDVEIARTPDEAISCVAAAPPDLVVLDLYLPDGAALKLLRLWKAEAPTLAVILESGEACLPAVVDALKEGAHTFFTKPVSAAALLSEFEERQHAQSDSSSLVCNEHPLEAAVLKADFVDRFFAVSPDLLSVAGFDGYFKALNPAWELVLGYSISELCSMPYLELVHPDDREKATDEVLEMRGGQAVFRFRNRYRCKDGSYRWLAWSATPSPSQRLIYASARDITKSVNMERGLRESNLRLKQLAASREALLRESAVKNEALIELGRFKDDVAAMIVHDLKNPLAVIVSNYGYVLEAFEGSKDCLEALRDSQTAARRMLRLLSNLIDVARLEDGTLDVHPSEIVLSSLLRPIAEQRRVLARGRRIALVVAPTSDLTATVDADLVTRTVENIFDNALRHTPNGGSIEMDVREVGADVELRIGNSGCAIPFAARSTIFDKYRQVGVQVERVNLGLGLYFCRLAIEAQGGQIWVEETDHLPTVFGIRLPRRQVVGSPRAAAEPALHLDA